MKLHANIQFRDGDQPGAHYVSGNLVFDEFFVNGRLLTRYWNPNGQIWSELNLSSIKWDKDQPADTFQLSINQCDLSGGYTWVSNSIESEGEVKIGVIHLRHTRTNVDVKVYTRVDGSPFIIRWLEITNVNQEAVGISAVSPMSGALWTHRYEEHLPSQYTSPFELAYNHSFEWGREGDFWFEPLPDGSKSINGEKKGRSGWGRPAFLARNLCNGQTFVCELDWGGNY